MKHGWIKIHRKIVDWEWYSDTNTCRVFLHLILISNWKAGRFKGVSVPVGSSITSYSGISKPIGLSVQQTRTALDKLKSTGEITVESTGFGLLVTVLQYGSYNDCLSDQQQGEQQGEQHLGNTSVTDDQQLGNNNIRKEEGEKGKKEKNFAKKNPDEDFKKACSVELDFTASEKLKATWSQWQIYRVKLHSKKTPWTEQAANIAKKNLQAWAEKHGDDAVIAKVEYAITKPNITFFEPEQRQALRSQQPVNQQPRPVLNPTINDTPPDLL